MASYRFVTNLPVIPIGHAARLIVNGGKHRAALNGPTARFLV
jgi:hypothetical protein